MKAALEQTKKLRHKLTSRLTNFAKIFNLTIECGLAWSVHFDHWDDEYRCR